MQGFRNTMGTTPEPRSGDETRAYAATLNVQMWESRNHHGGWWSLSSDQRGRYNHREGLQTWELNATSLIQGISFATLTDATNASMLLSSQAWQLQVELIVAKPVFTGQAGIDPA